jgi:hypothetical protein
VGANQFQRDHKIEGDEFAAWCSCASIDPPTGIGKTVVVEPVDQEIETYYYGDGTRAEKNTQIVRFHRLAQFPEAFVHDFHAHPGGPKSALSKSSMLVLLVFITESKPNATHRLIQLLADPDVAHWLARSTAGIWFSAPLSSGAACSPSFLLGQGRGNARLVALRFGKQALGSADADMFAIAVRLQLLSKVMRLKSRRERIRTMLCWRRSA